MRLMKGLCCFCFMALVEAHALSFAPIIKAGKPHQLNQEKFIEVYAHRGDRAYYPENSIGGYKTALRVGIDWVDMDIVSSADGTLVVYHDLWINPDFTSLNGQYLAKSNAKFLQQMNNSESQLAKHLLKNISFSELQNYDIGTLNPDSSYKSYFPDQVVVKDTRIPSMQEVVDMVEKVSNKKMLYQIEIKNDPSKPNWSMDNAKLAKSLYTLLKKNNLIKRVEIQAFDWNVLYELQQLDKNIKTAYLVGHDDILRMQESNVAKAGLWSNGKLLKDYNNSLPQMVKALGGSCYEPEDVALTKKDLDEAHKLGLKVVVWTWPEHSGSIFDVKLIDKLIRWGVDGIISDDPARLNSMLAARGYRTPMNYQMQ